MSKMLRIKVETQCNISSLINCLTDNEDLRQELWVHYLSGNPVDTFSSYLQKLQAEQKDHIFISRAMWELMKSEQTEDFSVVWSSFSEYEQAILFLVVVGYSISDIAERKSACEVRIRQTLSSVRYNQVWQNVYGIKDKTD